MDLIKEFVAWVQSFFACQHQGAVPRVELVPGLEYVRYYRKCPDCGHEWDE